MHPVVVTTEAAAALLTADDGLRRGMGGSDPAGMGALLHEGFELVCSTGERMGRGDWLAAVCDPRCRRQVRRDGPAAVRMRGATGIVTGLVEEHVRYSDETRCRRELITDTWVLDRGGWQLLARHASIVDECWTHPCPIP